MNSTGRDYMVEQQPTIAVDLDDVLFDFIGAFFRWHNQRYGTNLQAQDMVFDRIWDVWGGTKEEAAERVPSFFREVDLLRLEPIPGAVEALNKLKARYQLTVISARDTATSSVTRAWIDKYFPGIFDEVALGIANPIGHSRPMTKAEVCRRNGVSVLVDDQLVHAQECAEAGIRVLLFGDSPWNQSETLPPTVVRVEDWVAVCGVLLHET